MVFCAATLALASATAIEFHKVDAFAGKILLPYVAWLVFANALNYSIWKKNPGVRFMRATLQLTGVLAAYSLRNSLCLLYQAEQIRASMQALCKVALPLESTCLTLRMLNLKLQALHCVMVLLVGACD